MKMSALALTAALAALAGCAQQQVTDDELRCAGGAMSGAAVGAVIGNQFGEGSGKTVMTAAGALAGGALVANQACK